MPPVNAVGIGDRLEVLPNHIALAVNLDETMHGVRNGAVERDPDRLPRHRLLSVCYGLWSVTRHGGLQPPSDPLSQQCDMPLALDLRPTLSLWDYGQHHVGRAFSLKV